MLCLALRFCYRICSCVSGVHYARASETGELDSCATLRADAVVILAGPDLHSLVRYFYFLTQLQQSGNTALLTLSHINCALEGW